MLLLYVIIWYISSAACVINSKVVLQQKELILILTFGQFFCSFLTSLIGLLKFRIDPINRFAVVASIAYTIGFLLLNFNLKNIDAYMSEVLRTAEPLTTSVVTFIMSYFMQDYKYSYDYPLILLFFGFTIIIFESQLKFIDILIALSCNSLFSLRSVFSKRANVSVQSLYIFQNISSVIITLPFFIFSFKSLNFKHIINTSFIEYFTSCAAFSIYNAFSLITLDHTDPVTHSTFNTIRRIITIFMSATFLTKRIHLFVYVGLFTSTLASLWHVIVKTILHNKDLDYDQKDNLISSEERC